MFLLNNKKFVFKTKDLPCLIHGHHGAGSSYLTIELVADLYMLGHTKMILFTGYPMARDQFLKSTNNTTIPPTCHHFMPSGVEQPENVLSTIQNLEDHVVLIKNIELFDKSIYEHFSSHKKLIISGNIDACSFTSMILKQAFQTTITFSPSRHDLIASPETLPKYSAYISSTTRTGILMHK